MSGSASQEDSQLTSFSAIDEAEAIASTGRGSYNPALSDPQLSEIAYGSHPPAQQENKNEGESEENFAPDNGGGGNDEEASNYWDTAAMAPLNVASAVSI